MPAGPGSSYQHHEPHSHPAHSGPPDTSYDWKVHHPFGGNAEHVAIEVGPRRGLITRWRFVLPSDYHALVGWGVGPPGGGPLSQAVKREAAGGPVSLDSGPSVVWFGASNALSSRLSAYVVFEGDPPHYLAFGEADTSSDLPGRLEGITFGDSHPPHPPTNA